MEEEERMECTRGYGEQMWRRRSGRSRFDGKATKDVESVNKM